MSTESAHRSPPEAGDGTQPFERHLAEFDPGTYRGGRTLFWRVLWHAVHHLVFDRWWCPAKLRPTLLRLFGARVGHGVIIRHGVRVHWPWNVEIGNNVWIGEFAWLHSLADIVIEDDVCISQRALIITGSHHHLDPQFSYDNAPILLRRGSWVAAGATVLRGVAVGRHSVVGSGVVLHKNLPDNTIVTVPPPVVRPL